MAAMQRITDKGYRFDGAAWETETLRYAVRSVSRTDQRDVRGPA